MEEDMSFLRRKLGRRAFIEEGGRLSLMSAFALTFVSTVITACPDDGGSDDDDDGGGYGYGYDEDDD